VGELRQWGGDENGLGCCDSSAMLTFLLSYVLRVETKVAPSEGKFVLVIVTDEVK